MSDPYAMFDYDDEPDPDYDHEPTPVCRDCQVLLPVGGGVCPCCGLLPDDDPEDRESREQERRAEDLAEGTP